MEQYVYEVKITSDFAAAHNLRGFRAKCENLHGHNWKIEVVVRGRELDNSDILVDFGELKKETRQLLSEVDHSYLNELPFFKERNPSSESIAEYLFQRLAPGVDRTGRWLHSVTAWESSDACATFMRYLNGNTTNVEKECER